MYCLRLYSDLSRFQAPARSLSRYIIGSVRKSE